MKNLISRPQAGGDEAPTDARARQTVRFVRVQDFATARNLATDASFIAPHMGEHLRRLQAESGEDLGVLIRIADNALFFMDGPRHLDARRAVLRFLSYRKLLAWQPFLEQEVDHRLAHLAGSDSIDLIGDFAMPIYTDATRALLGLHPEPTASFDEQAARLQSFLQPLLPLRRLLDMQQGFVEMLEQLRRQRQPEPSRAHPLGLLAELQQTPPPGFDNEDLLALMIVLYGASINVAQTLGNVLHAIMSDATLRRAATSPQWIDQHLETLIRENASPRYIHRIASESRTIERCPFSNGDNILVDLPAIHDQCPARPDAPAPPHLAFGRGVHRCVGAAYSRLVLKAVIPRLFGRFPQLRLDTERPPLSLDHSQTRALRRLPCRL